MTKTVRDNIDGTEVDADESWEFTLFNRNDPRGLIKIEGDMSNSNMMGFYTKMVKKPKHQLWVRPTKAEKATDPDAKGHWEKIAEK